MTPPLAGRRVAITTDAVGGVWRYAAGVAAGLVCRGVRVTLIGLGPAPSPAQEAEARAAGARLVWLDGRLDWTAGGAAGAADLARALAARVAAEGADLIHLNAPALGGAAEMGLPTVAVAHSCLATWWRAVRGGAQPADWAWHRRLTARGLRRAAVAAAPSAAFAAELVAAYGPLPGLRVIHNAAVPVAPRPKIEAVLAAGRWWDEGKNLAAIDAAAGLIAWPVLAAGPTRGPGGEDAAARHARLLGPLEPEAMAARTAEAPIALSLALYEPFGLSVLEAATAGAALVLSDIPTFRELWNGAALFARPRDPSDAARAVNGLIADPALRARLGARAAVRAAAFTARRQSDALAAAYAEALAVSPLAAQSRA